MIQVSSSWELIRSPILERGCFKELSHTKFDHKEVLKHACEPKPPQPPDTTPHKRGVLNPNAPIGELPLWKRLRLRMLRNYNADGVRVILPRDGY
jgi:hypothetical protein